MCNSDEMKALVTWSKAYIQVKRVSFMTFSKTRFQYYRLRDVTTESMLRYEIVSSVEVCSARVSLYLMGTRAMSYRCYALFVPILTITSEGREAYTNR